MNVLDLFCGTGSSTAALTEAGHNVHGIEIDANVAATTHIKRHYANILDVARDPAKWCDENIAPGWRPDVIWASPPCTGFSVASMGKMWDNSTGVLLPKHDTARLGIELLRATLHIIEVLAPRHWWMENPRGAMRKMPETANLNRVTVWYCRYGDTRAKPTDLWGVWPATWKPRPPCHNGNPDHEAAPRGASTGTQGLRGAALRSMVPRALSDDIAAACESTPIRP